MGLDLRALAGTAFEIAKDLADQAFEGCTVKTNPTIISDPVSSVSTTSWGNTFSDVQLLGFDDADERKARGTAKRLRTFLADRADILAACTATGPGELTQTAQVTDKAGLVWEAYRVEYDPTRSAILFYCER